MSNVAAPDFDAWLSIEHLTGRVSIQTGFTDVCGGRVWWMRVGAGCGTPLLVLHGGPGSGHDSLLPLAALADERPIIFYDQLGCGKAQSPNSPQVYTIDRSVAELSAVRKALNLEKIDIFGHSWGSMLAIEYLCRNGEAGVRRLILSGAIASIPRFVKGTKRLLDGITAELHKFNPTVSKKETEAIFYQRHFCRAQLVPPYVARSATNLKHSIAYRVMNGPNEFTITGVIREWDRREALNSIKQPTLVTTGQYDEVAPEVIDDVVTGIRGSRRHVLENCSHLTSGEDPMGLLKVVREFLH